MAKRKTQNAVVVTSLQTPIADFSAIPHYMRDNEFIIGHYRVEWPLRQTFLSFFSLHNETLNVWTHFLGFLLFLCLMIYSAARLPTVSNNLQNATNFKHDLRTAPPHSVGFCFSGNHSLSNATESAFETMKEDMSNLAFPESQTPITRWPFFIFLGAATYCLFASTTFHLLSCHSKKMYYALLRLDYSGIVALISASFYLPVYYSFMCDPLVRDFYLTAITVVGISTILISLLPAFQNPEYRTVRALLFSGMGICGVAPLVHKLFVHRDQPEALRTTAYEAGMGCFYALGAVLYATRIPERWMPGKFDIAGHSHQLFHLLVIAGAYTHYQAGLLYLQWRDLKGC